MLLVHLLKVQQMSIIVFQRGAERVVVASGGVRIIGKSASKGTWSIRNGLLHRMPLNFLFYISRKACMAHIAQALVWLISRFGIFLF